METAKLKIIYVLTASGVGGAQRYVRDLAASLPKDRFEIKILTGGGDLHWLSNRISPFFLVNDWLAVLELAAAFRRERPDIIHLNSSKAGVLGSLAAFIYNSAMRPFGTPKAKVVFTAHGWVFNPANHPPLMVRRTYALLHRAAGFFQDAIINVSKVDYEIAMRYRIAPPQKLCTIHNGIDSNISFLNRETSREEILARLNPSPYPPAPEGRGSLNEIERLNPHLPWIGSVGRLTKEKDYATLILAVWLVPEVLCFVVGDGPEKTNLQLITKNLSSEGGSSSGGKLTSRIFFVPPDGNDALLMKAFDVFVLPSIKEGLPYTLLEAGAASIPAVVTDAGGMGEVLETFPMSVVPKRNPEALAVKIKEFIENPSLLEAAREAIGKSVRERYGLDRMIQATEAIYRLITQEITF